MPEQPELRGAGHFEGHTHILPIRIYYEDTDLSGLVYHANYLRYMERGRSEFFRSAGITRLAMLADRVASAWTLRRASLEFVRPARIDDLIEVHTRATALGGARMTADQAIYCDSHLLTQGRVEACIITLAGRPRRIPPDIREKLLPLVFDAKCGEAGAQIRPCSNARVETARSARLP
jgi:acyl-CoA thioester hydrolase